MSDVVRGQFLILTEPRPAVPRRRNAQASVGDDPVNRRLVLLDPHSAAHRKAHADWIAEREASFAKLFPEKQSRMAVAPDDSMIESLVKFFYAHMLARTRR